MNQDQYMLEIKPNI